MGGFAGRRPCLVAAAAALLVLGGCGGGGSQSGSTSAGSTTAKADHPGLHVEKVGHFNEPTFITQPPGKDQPLYVSEKDGRVVEVPQPGEPKPKPLLDIRKLVFESGEASLNSVAFPPDWERTGHFFVDYAGRDKHLHVDEFTARNGVADVSTRRPILSIPHPEEVHWAGLLHFSPNGDLYVSVGDGGPPSPIPQTAQDTNSLLGKILRIHPTESGDPPYTIPDGNPFATGGGAPEVLVYGVRNPWRYSIDPRTGDMWIGDVGDYTQEEIDFIPAGKVAGANLGWPSFEGTSRKPGEPPAPGALQPVLSYARTGDEDDPNCAVTGGYVVRDRAVPKLYGRYIYADYCRGQIRSFTLEDGKAHGDGPTGLNVPRLSSFATDQAGHVYVVSLGGDIFRIAQG
jgi:hypothetical protein